MAKYKIKLSKEYTRPFFHCDWDYNLLPPKLRAEFDSYLSKYIEEQRLVKGSSFQVRHADVLQKFVMAKRLNLVTTPGGDLVPQFILKQGEEKIIDGPARDSLYPRYGKYKVTRSDGVESDFLGFIEFETLEEDEPEVEISNEPAIIEEIDMEYEEKKEAPGLVAKAIKAKKEAKDE